MSQLDDKKVVNRTTNESYKERFEFILYIDDNIICQRYFKINRLIGKSLGSLELTNVLDYSVQKIKDDLTSKSRILTWYIDDDSPIKVIGRGGETIYIPYNKKAISKDSSDFKPYYDDDREKECTSLFKFVFKDNGEVLYSRCWDATNYQKFVRNSVDLTNNITPEMMGEHFSKAIYRYFNSGKSDVIYEIIKGICDVTCGLCRVEYNVLGQGVLVYYEEDEKPYFTQKIKYGDTLYDLNAKKWFESGWERYVKKKIEEYQSTNYYR